MKYSIRRYLEDELAGYPKLERRIEEVRLEVMDPWKRIDDNTGGGKSNTNVSTTEVKATRLINDKRLKRLQSIKQAIETVYNESSDEERQLMKLYYFSVKRTLTVEGIAQTMNVSTRTIHRMKTNIIKRFAEELGI